ncbi:MAG: alpha/beta hydrolase [Candidatus Nanopelagicales bacterium]
MNLAENLRADGRMVAPRPDLILRDLRTTRRGTRVHSAPRGHGRAVLLIPGLFAPNASLNRLARWLQRGGWIPVTAEVGLNIACSQQLADVVTKRARALHRVTGAPIVVIGQSRGGLHAKVLAVTAPDLVDTVVTLGSPLVSIQGIRPSTRRAVIALTALHRRGVGTLSEDCWQGSGCCADYMAALREAPRADIRFVSIYTATDRVILPDSCLDPAAEHVEVWATHQGMAMSREVWGELARILS